MTTTPKNITVLDTMDNVSVTTSTVKTISSEVTLHEHTQSFFVDVQDNDVYITFDGSTPSATVGHILKKDKTHILFAGMFRTAKMLGKDGTAVVAITQLNGML